MTLTAPLADALARTDLLSRLTPESRARLAGRGTELTLAPGAQLCSRGDPGDALYVIMEGEIEVSVTTPAGKQVRLASLGAGEVIGEMAVLDGLGRSADMAALRRTRLVRLGREAVLEALQAEPAALLALVEELAARLRHANTAMEEVSVLDLKGRLARLLLTESGEGAKLVQLTQTEMARRLGASREKVNRRLHTWSAQGYLSLSKTGVRLTRLDPLRTAAAGDKDGE
ncbi:MAG: Crp/Fnr family transcriptional regulator [Caulobacterales bacterium]|jgi:CRP-like cAMP-binding protein